MSHLVHEGFEYGPRAQTYFTYFRDRTLDMRAAASRSRPYAICEPPASVPAPCSTTTRDPRDALGTFSWKSTRTMEWLTADQDGVVLSVVYLWAVTAHLSR